jgi:DNA-binding MarR family transcriptional regulator
MAMAPPLVGSGLDSQLCVALYRATHAFSAAYRPILEPHGLTYPQYAALLALWDQPATEGALSMKGLGERLDLDSATLSPLLRRLEKAGLITRRRKAEDNRVVEIQVTASGRDLQEKLREAPARIGQCTGLSSPAVVELTAQLNCITDAIRHDISH